MATTQEKIDAASIEHYDHNGYVDGRCVPSDEVFDLIVEDRLIESKGIIALIATWQERQRRQYAEADMLTEKYPHDDDELRYAEAVRKVGHDYGKQIKELQEAIS